MKIMLAMTAGALFSAAFIVPDDYIPFVLFVVVACIAVMRAL